MIIVSRSYESLLVFHLYAQIGGNAVIASRIECMGSEYMIAVRQ
jgi:hypothetical protein